MYYIIQSLITLALLALISLLWIEVRRRASSPLRLPRRVWAYAVITAHGNGDGLEQTVAALVRALGDSVPAARIVINDCGLDRNGAAIARLLTRDYNCVIFNTNDT